jgi:hypothetical protein
MGQTIANTMIYKIIICLQHLKKQRKKKGNRKKKEKKEAKALEAFGPGWGSKPSHDYACSSLFDK